MTQTQLNEFRSMLEVALSALTGKQTISRENLATESTPDDLDRLQDASDREFAIGSLERASVRLRELRDALQRIRGGNFGECVSCEEAISQKRLAAVPWAPLCIKCQQAEDSGEAAMARKEAAYLVAA